MLVSIIIPTYNREKVILSTLKSILKQTISNWECIVIDDFSTDSTIKTIKKYIKKDSRFKLYTNKFVKGAPGARNTGLLKSKGEYICFFDSDDIMYPTNLEKKIAYLQNHTLVDVVTSYSDVLDINHEKIDELKWDVSGNIFKELLNRTKYVDTNSALFRSSILKDITWDEKCPSYQEWDFHLRLSMTARYGYIRENLCAYYKRNNGTISSDPKLDLQGRLYVYNKFKKYFVNELGVDKLFYILRDAEIECKKYNLKYHILFRMNIIDTLKFKYWKYCHI